MAVAKPEQRRVLTLPLRPEPEPLMASDATFVNGVYVPLFDVRAPQGANWYAGPFVLVPSGWRPVGAGLVSVLVAAVSSPAPVPRLSLADAFCKRCRGRADGCC